MKITNLLGLPEPLVRAVQNDRYDIEAVGDYSTTTLIRPARQVALQRAHRGEMSEDVSDRIWSLMGQVTHAILERAATEELVEKRLFMEVLGKTVSGQIDLYQGTTLWDFKVTSIYSGKNGPKDEWVQQGNINRLLCAENGIEVSAIDYCALYRDWSMMMSERGKADYPQSQIEVFHLPLWPLEKTRAFVEERIRVHEAAKLELPECSPEERWARPEKWALMKKGQKRAVKLYDTEEQAEATVKGPKEFVEHRPGDSLRCRFFCSALPFCEQGRELIMP